MGMSVYFNRPGIEDGIRKAVSATEEEVYMETKHQFSRHRMVLNLLVTLCLLCAGLVLYYIWPLRF